MDIYEKMKELGVELPAAPAKGGLYSSCKKFGAGGFLLLAITGPGAYSIDRLLNKKW